MTRKPKPKADYLLPHFDPARQFPTEPRTVRVEILQQPKQEPREVRIEVIQQPEPEPHYPTSVVPLPPTTTFTSAYTVKEETK